MNRRAASTRPPLSIISEDLAAIEAYRTHADPAPIKLDANESPWPLPEEARERLARALGDAELHRYPDASARRVRSAIAKRTGAREEELVLGVGSDEVISMLLAACRRPRGGRARASILVPSPTFVMVAITARVHGLEPIDLPLREDFSLDRDAVLAAIAREAPNLVYLATPNNPTGNRYARADVEAIAEAAGDALVVIDEAYLPFARAEGFRDLFDRHPHVALLGTLSKIGLAGIRLGWARLHPELAAELEKVRSPYNLNVYTQIAACVLLEEMPEVLDDRIERIVRERERVGAELRAMRGLRVFESEANFFLLELEGADRAHAALLERGVQLRRFAKDRRLARHLRATIGTPDENDRLLGALREILGS